MVAVIITEAAIAIHGRGRGDGIRV
uniref:Uncharacterized protein n=1 Tax=Arundo donax TaxID=35708 RepID=A0A0A8XSX5_ARUDO